LFSLIATIGIIVGIVALIKGNIKTLKIENRKVAAIILIASFILGVATAPDSENNQDTKDSTDAESEVAEGDAQEVSGEEEKETNQKEGKDSGKNEGEESADKKTEKEKEPKKEPTVEEKLKKAVHKGFNEKNSFDDGDSIIAINNNEEEKFVLVKVYGRDNLTTNMIKKGMWMGTADVLQEMKDMDEIETVDFNIVFPMQDKYGETSDDIVMKFSFSKETRERINWENFVTDNLPEIADSYWQHPAFND